MSDQGPHRDDDERAFREPAPTTTAIQAISRRNWTRGLIALAVALIVLVGLGFASARINDYASRSPEQVALDDIESAADARAATTELTTGGTATVEWSEALGTAVFHSADLPAIGDDEQFALWFTRGQQSAPAGVFASEGRSVLVVLDGAVTEGDLVVLTVEPAGSAPAGPSGEPLVAIPTS
jgi:Anti-sigma-K factor rskA, C-terminal